MLDNKSKKKFTLHLVLSLILFIPFSNVSFAVATKDCNHLFPQTESWVAEGKLAAVQMAFNKFSGGKANFSLTDGYLRFYDPKDTPEVEALLKRDQKGVFQLLPQFVMEEFIFNKESGSHSDHRDFPTAQKDKIYLVILSNGEVFIILKNRGNAVLPVENLLCFTGGFLIRDIT